MRGKHSGRSWWAISLSLAQRETLEANKASDVSSIFWVSLQQVMVWYGNQGQLKFQNVPPSRPGVISSLVTLCKWSEGSELPWLVQEWWQLRKDQATEWQNVSELHECLAHVCMHECWVPCAGNLTWVSLFQSSIVRKQASVLPSSTSKKLKLFSHAKGIYNLTTWKTETVGLL